MLAVLLVAGAWTTAIVGPHSTDAHTGVSAAARASHGAGSRAASPHTSSPSRSAPASSAPSRHRSSPSTPPPHPQGSGTPGPGTSFAPKTQLPRGGTKVFPRYRVVAYYGTAGSDALGVLGAKPPKEIAPKIEKAAKPFKTPARTVQPAMELIVDVADGSPGKDGDYNHQISAKKVWQYEKVAEKQHMLLILDIQPGQSSFLPLVKHWKKLLAKPNVGLALDSEWHMPKGVVPAQEIGHSTAAQINKVSSWLADLVDRDHLPQKVFIFHQFTVPMIKHVTHIKTPPELAVIQHLDGFGTKAAKLAKWKKVKKPDDFHMGFKLFYTQDTHLMSPKQTLKLEPPPEYISYQ
jgi:hypothetical protein